MIPSIICYQHVVHIAEELWEKAGQNGSVAFAEFPEFDSKWLVEDSKDY